MVDEKKSPGSEFEIKLPDMGIVQVPADQVQRLLRTEALATSVANSTPNAWVFYHDLFAKDAKVKKPLSSPQAEELRELLAEGIDPLLFDSMLSTKLDRKLKSQFAGLFFIATVFFSFLSYAVIILNSVLKWGISDIAITALIVETPIQFIGLLYIIARNLFPQSPTFLLRQPNRPGESDPQDSKGSRKRGQGKRSPAVVADD